MSSIDNKNGPISAPLAGPDAGPSQSSAPTAAQVAGDKKTREIIETQGSEAILAMMGMAPAGLTRVFKGEPSNKFSAAALITSSPPPLPADRAPVTLETQALYESMSQDVAHAMGQANPKTRGLRHHLSVGSGSNISTDAGTASSAQAATGKASQAAETQAAPEENFFAQLSAISDEEAATPAGAAKVEQIAAQGFGKAMANIDSMTGGSMMQQFMMLRVENKSSGKELMSTMQDLMTESRNSQLKKQQMAGQAAQEATKKAEAKQDQIKILAPLIEAVVALLTVVVSVMTAGSATGVAIVLGVALLGFIMGGAIGGATKGTGFDASSALMGLAIGAGVSRLLATSLVKLVAMVLEKVGAQTASKAAAASSAKAFGNMSTKATITESIGLGAVEATGDVSKAIMDFRYAQMLIEAKKHQANGKMASVMAEMMQNSWKALQGTLTGMTEMHNTSVQQVLAMMKNQFAASQKTVANITR